MLSQKKLCYRHRKVNDFFRGLKRVLSCIANLARPQGSYIFLNSAPLFLNPIVTLIIKD